MRITTDTPPLSGDKIRCRGWWGCPDWVVRFDREPTGLRDVDIGDFLDSIHDSLPGDPLDLRPVRWAESGLATPPVACHPLGNGDYSLNPAYLIFLTAAAEPDEWRWVEYREADESSGHAAHAAVGLRDGEPVAIVAPQVEPRFLENEPRDAATSGAPTTRE